MSVARSAPRATQRVRGPSSRTPAQIRVPPTRPSAPAHIACHPSASHPVRGTPAQIRVPLGKNPKPYCLGNFGTTMWSLLLHEIMMIVNLVVIVSIVISSSTSSSSSSSSSSRNNMNTDRGSSSRCQSLLEFQLQVWGFIAPLYSISPSVSQASRSNDAPSNGLSLELGHRPRKNPINARYPKGMQGLTPCLQVLFDEEKTSLDLSKDCYPGKAHDLSAEATSRRQDICMGCKSVLSSLTPTSASAEHVSLETCLALILIRLQPHTYRGFTIPGCLVAGGLVMSVHAAACTKVCPPVVIMVGRQVGARPRVLKAALPSTPG